MSTLERQLGSMASFPSSTSSTLSFDEDDELDDVPQLPLRRKEGDLRRAGARTQKEQRQASTSVKWVSTLSSHPLVGALGAFLTIVLPPRVTSTLSQYASALHLTSAADDDDDLDLPTVPPTGEQSPWDARNGYGFYVAITPPTPLYLGELTSSPGSTPLFFTTRSSPEHTFKTNGGRTPPLVRAPPHDGAATPETVVEGLETVVED